MTRGSIGQAAPYGQAFLHHYNRKRGLRAPQKQRRQDGAAKPPADDGDGSLGGTSHLGSDFHGHGLLIYRVRQYVYNVYDISRHCEKSFLYFASCSTRAVFEGAVAKW